MLKQSESTIKERIVSNLVQFIQKNRILLLLLLLIVILSPLVFFIWSKVDDDINEEAAILVEGVQQEYSNWLAETDEKKRADREKTIMDKINMIIKSYSGRYAEQRARFIEANLYLEKVKNDERNREDYYNKAIDEFLYILRSFPDSYLSQIALYRSGQLMEDIDYYGITLKEDIISGLPASPVDEGDKANPQPVAVALILYDFFIEKYKDSPLLPNAIFSSARLNEENRDYDVAKELYFQLERDFPNSNWTILAKRCIINLKAMGLIE